MVGARMANLKHGANRHDLEKPMGHSTPAITIERAAELSGSSKRNIQRAKPIVQSGIRPGSLEAAQDHRDHHHLVVIEAGELA